MENAVRLRRGVVRSDWLEHPEVGAAEFAVLCTLALFADELGVCWPSQGLLAAKLKKSRAWVGNVIARLNNLGLVEVEHRYRQDGGYRSCRYTLVGHDATFLRGAKAAHEGAQGGTAATHAAPPTSPCQSSGTACQPAGIEHESQEQTPDSRPAAARETVISFDKTRKGRVETVVPPEDWQPSDQALIWALNRFPEADLLASVEMFVLKSRAKGYRYADLDAGWKVWLKQDMAAEREIPGGSSCTAPSGKGPGGHVSPNQVRFEVWAAVANRAA